jgi:cyanophycinase
MTSRQAVPYSFRPRGVLMPIGGREDKADNPVILSRFVALAGGSAARVVVIPTASEYEGTGPLYEGVFRDLGVRRATVLHLPHRDFANSDKALAPLRSATGVFISGGDQVRLVEFIGGTRLADCIRERYAAGIVVAGTSAGASILAGHMMDGGGNRDTPRKGMVNMIAGFGLAPELIIDQHFSQRGRIGRLLTLLAASPGLIALGIDENTGAIITPDRMLEVIGANSITILDGRRIWSDYHEIAPNEALSLTDVTLHVLHAGHRFNLETRRPLDHP